MSESMDLGKTAQRRVEQYRDRWTSFDTQTGLIGISDRPTPEKLREFEIFEDYDDKFLEKISPDVSIAIWESGAILFEEGTYIDLAFFIAEGEIELFLRGVGGDADESTGFAQPIFDPTRTMVGESLVGAAQATSGTVMMRRAVRRAPTHITLLSSMDFDLPHGAAKTLGPGTVLGEMGAMSGWPQSATARTASQCRVVQIRVPALRLMKRKSKAFKERLDAAYRERLLGERLKSTPVFSCCSDAFIDAMKERVELVSRDPDEVIVREGEPAQDLYVVRSGFVKLMQRFSEGEIVVTYLSKGMTLGETELLVDEIDEWQTTAVSVEYAELIKVPGEIFGQLIQSYPEAERQLWSATRDRVREIGFTRRHIGHAEFTQVALDTGLVQGNSILAIDLSSCTRCDDCVRACAATHDGRARFVREGDKIGNLLIARSCYHCRDPVCLVGCPTGAIHRAGVGDVVAVDEEVCIGCSNCARNCPYDAIVMQDAGEVWPEDMVPTGLRGRDREVASKCDLCFDTGHGPACVSNCPQGCAYRVGSLEEFQLLLEGKGS